MRMFHILAIFISYIYKIASSPGSRKCVSREGEKKTWKTLYAHGHVYGYYVSEKYDCLHVHVYGKCFLDDALSYSQKVLGLQNVTFKEQQVVAIKSV